LAGEVNLMDNRDREHRDNDENDLENPLGIAREPVPPDPAIRASDDEESIQRRRKRAGLGHEVEERRSTGLESLDGDPLGATGIDLGGAGKGTDLKP
jgi:hypothetical protein